MQEARNRILFFLSCKSRDIEAGFARGGMEDEAQSMYSEGKWPT